MVKKWKLPFNWNADIRKTAYKCEGELLKIDFDDSSYESEATTGKAADRRAADRDRAQRVRRARVYWNQGLKLCVHSS